MKKSAWCPTHPPLLDYLGPVYVEEKCWDKLSLLVQQKSDLRTTMQYHPLLIEHHPAALIDTYLAAFSTYADSASNRDDDHFFATTMKDVIRIPAAKDKITALAEMFKRKFSSKPRRPALIDELAKLF